jgi:serine/threonine protein kinase
MPLLGVVWRPERFNSSLASFIVHRAPIKELVLGRVLGRGGFCVVHEIKAVNLNPSGPGDDHEKKSGDKDQIYTRGFIKARCLRDGQPRYAIKQLSEESRADKTRFLKGTIDLAIEAKFLAVLDHPHIIKMRGAASFGPFDAPGYYLILDKLVETLEERLRKWVKTNSRTKGVLGKVTGGKKRQDKLILEKAHVAYDLATALKFMHSNGYVHSLFCYFSAVISFCFPNRLVSPHWCLCFCAIVFANQQRYLQRR